jgi:hypothetical protein
MELLVVIATTALLVALVVPALARSGDGGARMVCANNLRQLGIASNLYAEENQDYLPWPNWDGGKNIPPAGWLYGGNVASAFNYPSNLSTGVLSQDTADWNLGRVANLKTGVYWQYVPNADSFECPADAQLVGTAFWEQRYQKLSSYTMNGASCYYASININMYGFKTCKRTDVWSPLCYLQWEANPTNAYTYNDGANYPNLPEGMGSMHFNGGNALTIAGNVDFIKIADFQKLEYPPNNLLGLGPKTLFHWNPMTPTGSGLGEVMP